MKTIHHKLAIIFSLMLLFVPIMISAAEPDYVTTFGRNYSLSISVELQGIPVNSLNTQCNLTLKDTLHRIVIDRENMSISDGGYASTNVNSTILRKIGQYPFRVNCISGAANKSVSGLLETTSDGEKDPNNTYLILILMTGAFIVLGFGMKMENEWVGFVAGILFMLSAIFIFSEGILTYNNLYTQGLASVNLLFFAWTGVAGGYKVMEEMKLKYS